MSKLAQFKALEAELAAQLKQLDALKNDDQLKREIRFEEELRKLMDEYDMDLRSVVELLEPQAEPDLATATARTGQRRQRQLKVYRNPENGDVVETKGGNHKILKAWKAQYGAQTVESWLQ